MNTNVGERVNVITVYNAEKGLNMPIRLRWQRKVYRITQLGFHHTVRDGRRLYHIYSVTDGSLAFRLQLDTESLIWTLEEISDGLAN